MPPASKILLARSSLVTVVGVNGNQGLLRRYSLESNESYPRTILLRSTKIRSNFAFTEFDDAGALSVERSGVSRFWPACLGDVPLLGLARLASRRWLTRWSPRLRLMPTPSACKSACRQIS